MRTRKIHLDPYDTCTVATHAGDVKIEPRPDGAITVYISGVALVSATGPQCNNLDGEWGTTVTMHRPHVRT